MSEVRPIIPSEKQSALFRLDGAAVSERDRRALLWVILIAAAILRLYALGDIPPPIDNDEASRGYDAWSLWETGRDQYGVWLPPLLRSFGPGDYSGAASAYLSAPLVGLLGPSILAIRLTTALLGVATVALVYGWLRRERGETLALAAAALLAMNPWHVRMCRWAHEANVIPFFLAAGMYAACRAGFRLSGDRDAATKMGVRDRGELSDASGPLWALFSGLAFGAGAWAYPASRLFIPLLLLGTVAVVAGGTILGFSRQSRGRWTLAALLVGLAVGAAPILCALAFHPEQVTGRMEYTAVFSRNVKLLEPSTYLLLRQYSWYWNPLILAWRSEIEHGGPFAGFSRLLLPEVLLLAIGLVRLFATAWTDRLARLLLIWCILYPMPAALSVGDAPSSMRAMCGLPLLPIVEGFGAAWLLSMASSWGQSLAKWLAVALLVNGGIYVWFYVTRLPAAISHVNQEELFNAFEWVRESGRAYDAVYVTSRTNQPQVLMLLATRFDPQRLHEAARFDVPWETGFTQTLQIGEWHFLAKRSQDPWTAYDLLDELAKRPPGQRILVICRGYSPSRKQYECPVGRVVAEFSSRDGVPWLEAREVITRAMENRE